MKPLSVVSWLRGTTAIVALAILALGAPDLAEAQTLIGSSNDETGYDSTIHAAVTAAIEAGEETFLVCKIDTSTYGTQMRGGAGGKTRVIPGAAGQVTWEKSHGCDRARPL